MCLKFNSKLFVTHGNFNSNSGKKTNEQVK